MTVKKHCSSEHSLVWKHDTYRKWRPNILGLCWWRKKMMLMLQNKTLMTQYVVFYDGIKLVYIYSSPSEKKQDIWHIHTYSIQRSSTSINLRWLQTRVAFLWRSSWVQIWGLALSKSHWFQVLKILLLQIRWFINVYHLPNCETDLLEYPPLDKNWQTRLVQLQSQLSLLKNPHYDEMYNHYFPIYCWFTGHPSIFKYDM